MRTTYSIRENHLFRTNKVTYLEVELSYWVTISNNESWNVHIKSTATAGHNKFSFLHRILYQCTQERKDMCLKLEYACNVWDSSTNKNVNQLGSIEKKVVCSNYRSKSSIRHAHTLEMRISSRHTNKDVSQLQRSPVHHCKFMCNHTPDLTLTMRTLFSSGPTLE